MGGYGSGRRPQRIALSEARLLYVGELCDGGRAQRRPRGVVNFPAAGGLPSAQLHYTISAEPSASGAGPSILTVRYRPFPGAPEAEQRLVLERIGGRGAYRTFCPRCGRSLRKLYAPPDAEHFLCHRCHGLVYRGSLPAHHRRDAQRGRAPERSWRQ